MSKEPTFDADGYPTEATVETIRTWNISTATDAIECMDYVGRAWKWPDWGWKKETGWADPDGTGSHRTVTRYLVSTGGWSGNEDLIGAVESNLMMQLLGWWSSRRGGHYEYRFPEDDAAVYGLPREAAAAGS